MIWKQIRCALFVFGMMILTACSSQTTDSGDREPAGTPTDPVKVCKKAVDVCQYQGSQLGVCSRRDDGSLYCMPQH